MDDGIGRGHHQGIDLDLQLGLGDGADTTDPLLQFLDIGLIFLDSLMKDASFCLVLGLNGEELPILHLVVPHRVYQGGYLPGVVLGYFTTDETGDDDPDNKQNKATTVLIPLYEVS